MKSKFSKRVLHLVIDNQLADTEESATHYLNSLLNMTKPDGTSIPVDFSHLVQWLEESAEEA